MKKYIEDFDAQIRSAPDVLIATDTFTALLEDRAAIKEMILRLVYRLRDNSECFPEEASANNILLSSSNRPSAHCDLGLSRYRITSPSIVSTYVYGLLASLNGPLQVEHYQLPSDWKCEVFEAGLRLERLGEFTLQPGTAFKIEPGLDVYRFKIDAETLILKLTSRPVTPFEWSFDDPDLAAWQSISTIPSETHLVHACNGASALGQPEFLAPLHALLTHERHIVRWAALQAICRLDPDVGVEGLKTLRQDLHPHIFRAAQSALACVA